MTQLYTKAVASTIAILDLNFKFYKHVRLFKKRASLFCNSEHYMCSSHRHLSNIDSAWSTYGS